MSYKRFGKIQGTYFESVEESLLNYAELIASVFEQLFKLLDLHSYLVVFVNDVKELVERNRVCILNLKLVIFKITSKDLPLP